METTKWLFGYLKKYRILSVVALFLAVVNIIFILINPYVSGKIIDDVIIAKNYDLLYLYIGAIFISVIIRETAQFFSHLALEHISQNVVKEMRGDLYKKLEIMDFHFFDTTRTGDLMSRMTEDLNAMRVLIADTSFNFIKMVLLVVIGFSTLITVSPIMTLFLVSTLPFLAYFAIKMAKTNKKIFIKVRESLAKLNSTVQENISGNRVVKAYTAEDFELEKFQKANEYFRETHIEFSKNVAHYVPKINFCSNLTRIIFITAGSLLLIFNKITVGEFGMVNGMLWFITAPMLMLGGLLNQYEQFFASSIKIRNLLDQDPKIKNNDKAYTKQEFKGKVQFKNVTFSYSEERVLKYINFTVNPGKTIAIIGPTGSGKSSLVNLISRFYDPDYGTIYLDDINVKNIDTVTLRENVSMAMQDIFLFSNTVSENIAYGVPDASEEDIIKVAKAADAHEFISQLPAGYDTIIGERGVGLSGGQKQRIALARALLKKPAVLILDDTTSALDMETEFSVQQELLKTENKSTVFIIAHRISSVKNADLILVLNDGRMIEWGNHNTLLKQKGYYYNVFKNQLGDFNNGPHYENDPLLDSYTLRNGDVYNG